MVLDGKFPHDERVEKEALSLIDSGYDVSVLSLKVPNKSNFEHNGIKVIPSNISDQQRKKLTPFLPILSWYQRLWVKEVIKNLEVESYKVIHTHDLPMAAVGYEIKKMFPNIKLVVDLHENYPSLVSMMNYMSRPFHKYIFKTKYWYKKEKVWISNADLIICTAEGMKQRIKNIGTSSCEIAVLENTIDIENFRSGIVDIKDIDKGENTVLIYTGGVTKNRGLKNAIKGFELSRRNRENLEFWIVGQGSELEALKHYVNESKTQGVRFFGWVTPANMFELIEKADIGVIPHVKYEHTDNTSPNKIFHYWYFSKPIIVSDCNFLEKRVNEVKGGVVFKSGDPKNFNKKLDYLLSKNITSIGRIGRDYVLEIGNWKVTAKMLIAAYSKLN